MTLRLDYSVETDGERGLADGEGNVLAMGVDAKSRIEGTPLLGGRAGAGVQVSRACALSQRPRPPPGF